LPFLYRAARNKTWVADGVINEDAFRRRLTDNLGLSVSEKPEQAAASLKKCHGMIRLDVEKMSVYRYSTVPDEDHLSIPEPPFDTEENRSEVLKHASALIRCSEIIPWPNQ